MRKLVVVLAALAVVAFWSGEAHAQVAGVCTTQDGTKVKCVKFNPRETPRPTQVVPTHTPVPVPCPRIERLFVERSNPAHERFIEVGAGDSPAFVPGELRCFSFDVPNGVPLMSMVSVSTINRGNAQCSELVLDVQTPSGQMLSSFGSQPGVISFAQDNVGTWFIYARLSWGEGACRKFKIVGAW